MINDYDPLEWDDGTPVIGTVEWSGPMGRRVIFVLPENGADDVVRPSGYYNEKGGGYEGSENLFPKLRNVVPTGPEPYEEWFKS